jgi:hypothetical protein
MKTLLFCLVLAALPVIGDPPEASLAPIALYTHFQHEPPPAVFDALQDEVKSIMTPTDLQFTWYSHSAAHGGVVSVVAVVITFKGACDVFGLTPHSSNPGPLGWTHISDGVILPFAEIDCQGIREFIQKQLLVLPAEEREEAYGRALGRVLGHELYHIFANTTRHGTSGVAKSKFTAQELLSPKFQFEGCESLALRTSKAHTALEWAAFGR